MSKEIYDYWSHRIPYTWGSYKEMRNLRYGLQDYMHDVFNFNQFKDKKVLEIGCGSGIDSVEFAKNGAHVWATDMTQNAVEETIKLFKKLKFDTYPHTIEKADVTDLPYQDSFFDLVYTYGVIHHIPPVEKALHEIYRVLRPGGSCYAMLYHRDSLLYYYSILFIGGIMRDGFKNGLTERQLLSKYGEAKQGCPYTRVYTEAEAKQLFKDFKNVETQVEYPVIDTPLVRKVKIPNLPRHLGWHIIVKARK